MQLCKVETSMEQGGIYDGLVRRVGQQLRKRTYYSSRRRDSMKQEGVTEAQSEVMSQSILLHAQVYVLAQIFDAARLFHTRHANLDRRN